MLLRHIAERRQQVGRSATPRLRLKQIPDEAEMRGQKIVLDRTVTAAGTAQPGDATPIVVERDVFRRQRREHNDRTAAVFRFRAFDHRAADEPFGMLDAAVETPAAVEAKAAGFAYRVSGREK